MNAGKRESKGEFGLEYAYDDEHGYDLVGRPMRKKKKRKVCNRPGCLVREARNDPKNVKKKINQS